MTSQISGKFVLKHTTKMSLSDRFTQYQKMRPEQSPDSDESAKTTSAQQASAVNRRYQQLLANRPSVQESVGNLNKMSVKQRLGPSNVKVRLNFNATRLLCGQRDVLGRGSGQRGGVDRWNQFRGSRGRQNGCMGRSGAGIARGGKFDDTLGDFRGNRGFKREDVARRCQSAFDEDRRFKGANRLRGNQFRRSTGRQNGCMGRSGAGISRGGRFEYSRGDFRGNRGTGREEVARGGRNAFDEDRRGRGANRLRGGGRGSFQRGGRGRGLGLRRGRGDNLPITEEQLNNQLDEYMSNKRAYQDQEMVTYMDQDDS